MQTNLSTSRKDTADIGGGISMYGLFGHAQAPCNNQEMCPQAARSAKLVCYADCILIAYCGACQCFFAGCPAGRLCAARGRVFLCRFSAICFLRLHAGLFFFAGSPRACCCVCTRAVFLCRSPTGRLCAARGRVFLCRFSAICFLRLHAAVFFLILCNLLFGEGEEPLL